MGSFLMKAVLVHNYGGPDVLKYEDASVPVAGKGEAVVKISAAGLNFVDIYYRTGLYKAPQLPFLPGQEAAWTVWAIGGGVGGGRPGGGVSAAIGPRSSS